LDINVDIEDVECEPGSPLKNFISVQPHTKNEKYKTPAFKIKKIKKKSQI